MVYKALRVQLETWDGLTLPLPLNARDMLLGACVWVFLHVKIY